MNPAQASRTARHGAAFDQPTQAAFRSHFRALPAHGASAPATCIALGNTAALADGLALGLALDARTYVAVSRRYDGGIEIAGQSPSEPPARIELGRYAPDAATAWANGARALLARLQRRGVHFTGFQALIRTTIPKGTGLGENTATICALALAVRQLFPFRLAANGLGEPPARDRRGFLPPPTPQERSALAMVCGLAAEEAFGEFTGPAHALTALHGQAHGAVVADLLHHTAEPVPWVGDVAVVAVRLARPRLEGADLVLEQKQRTLAARAALGTRSLRRLTPEDMPPLREQLPPEVWRWTRHLTEENQRVVHAERALRDQDLSSFGGYLQQHLRSFDGTGLAGSHGGTELIRIAAKAPGWMGGWLPADPSLPASVNLVTNARMDEFCRFMFETVAERTSMLVECFPCGTGSGAA